MTFPSQLRSERSRLNLSQTEAAALIPPLSVRVWQKWEGAAATPPPWAQRLILAHLARQRPRKTGHFEKPGNPHL